MKKRLIQIFLIILLILIFLYSDYLIKNIIDYTQLFINNLFFYMFIIYIISSLLVDYDLLSSINPIFFVTLMSLISGFPSGAKYTKELLDKDYITDDIAKYLVTYTHYPNPLFILGSVSMLVGKSNSICILLSIYFSSFITSRFFKAKKRNYQASISNIPKLVTSLNKAINNTLNTIILVYGTSIISLIIGLLVVRVFHPQNIIYSLIFGLFDLTKGIFSTAIIRNKRISCILILLFINVGSLSIHMQVKSILNSNNLYKKYLVGRLLSTIVSVFSFDIIHSLMGILY